MTGCGVSTATGVAVGADVGVSVGGKAGVDVEGGIAVAVGKDSSISTGVLFLVGRAPQAVTTVIAITRVAMAAYFMYDLVYRD